LVLQPVTVGVNWYTAMDNPDASGLVQPTGTFVVGMSLP
jgi:hypothetical protein